MPESDLLIAIAQIALALAGFSGLVAAIATTSPGGWHPRDIWSLSWMLGASIGALVLALLPPWLALFGGPAALAYRAGCAVAFLYVLALVTTMAWSGRRLTRSGSPPRVPFIPTILTLALCLAAGVAVAGTAGWLGDALVPAYVGILIILLLASVLVLVVFLILLAKSTRRP